MIGGPAAPPVRKILMTTDAVGGVWTYGVDLAAHGDDGAAAAYLETALGDPDFRRWEAAAGSSA